MLNRLYSSWNLTNLQCCFFLTKNPIVNMYNNKIRKLPQQRCSMRFVLALSVCRACRKPGNMLAIPMISKMKIHIFDQIGALFLGYMRPIQSFESFHWVVSTMKNRRVLDRRFHRSFESQIANRIWLSEFHTLWIWWWANISIEWRGPRSPFIDGDRTLDRFMLYDWRTCKKIAIEKKCLLGQIEFGVGLSFALPLFVCW
jgi:hypothetical protein